MNNENTEAKATPRPGPRKANECITDQKHFRLPRRLFDEFWREGELALLFGPAGSGKSVLAVQIADALARGRGLDGFRMPLGRHKVLYVDMEHSDTQFQERYSYFPPDDSCSKSYKFSENLYRDRPPANDDLCEWLRETVRENGFDVVIIDDLSAVKSTHDGTRETLSIMRRLRQIRDELRVSILVLTDSESPGRSGIVSEHDLKRSRVLCSTADSVFAIGQSRHNYTDRFIIQMRSRSASIVWTVQNAPVCRVTRMETGMLAFRFDERFAPRMDEETRRLICRVRSMHAGGTTYRAIAKELDISKSQASRLCKKWTPAMDRAEDVMPEEMPSAEEIIVPEDAWEPKEEAYRGEHTDRYLVSQGMQPVWKECETEARPTDDEAEISAEPEIREEPEDASLPILHPQLSARIDAYGREIFVESEDPNGKPTVWYQFDRQGTKLRFERTIYGINSERLNASPYL